MTSFIRQTWRSPFQQVCKYCLAHNSINFPNCILNFFLELCNTARSILIDNILVIKQKKKVQKVQICAMWRPLANSLLNKFCQKRQCIILLKNCIARILMQKCNKLFHNIVVNFCSNCCLGKKFVPRHICNSRHTKCQFFGDATTLFEKCEGSPNYKLVNFVHLCSHLIETPVTEEECIKHQNITARIATKPFPKLGSYWRIRV